MKLQSPDRSLFAMCWLALVMVVCAPLSTAAESVYDTTSKLKSRWGYLVIDTIVGRPTTNWRLDNGFTIDRLPTGSRTILIRLPAGDYQWEQIDVPYFDLPHELDVSDDRRWAFRVERQKINYAGTLVVSDTRSSESVGVRFINRSSGIIDKLREHYPQQLAELGVVFSGSYRDDFLTLVSNNDEEHDQN